MSKPVSGNRKEFRISTLTNMDFICVSHCLKRKNCSLNFVLISFDIVPACDSVQYVLTVLTGDRTGESTLAVCCLVVTWLVMSWHKVDLRHEQKWPDPAFSWQQYVRSCWKNECSFLKSWKKTHLPWWYTGLLLCVTSVCERSCSKISKHHT